MRFVPLLCCCFLFSENPDANKDDKAKRILLTLQDERIWSDKERTKELLGVLEQVKTLQPRSCIPVLLKHIDHTPYRIVRLMPLEMWIPAYGALSTFGLSAVQPLLDELRIEKPGDRVAGQELLGSVIRRTLTVSSLIALYDAGGHGRELAKARIELEAAKYPGEEGHFLRQALEDRWLRKD